MIRKFSVILAATVILSGAAPAQAQRGYPEQPGYPAAQPQSGYPSQPGYQGAPSGYQGAQSGYQGAQSGYQGAPSGYQGGYQGAPSGYQQQQQGYGGQEAGYEEDGTYGAPQAGQPGGMAPDDPRYGRANGTTYSASPQGPVMSPDDPRYGQPTPYDAGQQQGGADLRPPGSIGGEPGKPMTIGALPPEDQPEAGPAELAPNLRRQEVSFATKEPAGTIVVDTPNTYLYYVLGGGRAIRYGVRVGRQGFTWNGVQKISRKAEWPDWNPPPEMIDRQPYLPRFMAGGPGNPLGARAMYLGSTVYRIHGTNQPSTIGKFVSSGCIGMLNDDVSDLFNRVKVGTRVVVLPGSATTAAAQQVPNGQAGVPVNAPRSVAPPMPPPVTVR